MFNENHGRRRKVERLKTNYLNCILLSSERKREKREQISSFIDCMMLLAGA